MTGTNGAHVVVSTYVKIPADALISCNVDHGGAPCPDSLTVTNDEPAPDEVTTFEFGIELGLLLLLAIAAMAWIVIKVV